MDYTSVGSVRSGVSFSATPRKVIADGEEFDGEYLVKDVVKSASIQISTPEIIRNKVQGDK
jgi:hypothetical protein